MKTVFQLICKWKKKSPSVKRNSFLAWAVISVGLRWFKRGLLETLCTRKEFGSCAAPSVPTVLRQGSDHQPLWGGFLLGVEVGKRFLWSKVTSMCSCRLTCLPYGKDGAYKGNDLRKCKVWISDHFDCSLLYILWWSRCSSKSLGQAGAQVCLHCWPGCRSDPGVSGCCLLGAKVQPWGLQCQRVGQGREVKQKTRSWGSILKKWVTLSWCTGPWPGWRQCLALISLIPGHDFFQFLLDTWE